MSKAEKRERILNGALKVFARKGFYNSKISEIASEAGVADGTIYLYFKNKDALLISLFEDRMEWLISRLNAELDEIDDVVDKIRRYLRLHLSLALEVPALAEFITVELRQSSKFVREYSNPQFNEYLKILRRLIVRGQEEGRLRRDVDARVVSRSIFGALDELLLAGVLSSNFTPDALEVEMQQVAKIFLNGIELENG